jgi:threonine/homoserine/homoserine lactone efflux protein
MTTEQALAFLGFVVVIAGTPGPSNTLLTATGASVGVLRGVPALLGVAVGMAGLMLVVGGGLGALILDNPGVVTAVKWIGTAVLLWLAWKIASASGGEHVGGGRPVGFMGACMFQWANPKSWLACTSGAAAFLDPSRGSAAVQAALLAGLFVVAAVPSCFVWLAFGALVQRALRSARAQRIFNVTMGVLLALSAVVLLLD